MIAPTSAIAQGNTRRCVADDGVDDLIGATGVGQQFGEHRTQRDQDADAGRRSAETLGEGLQYRLEVLARDDAHRQRAEDQREERVQLTTVIKTTITAIPARNARISCQPDATGSASLGASSARIVIPRPSEFHLFSCWVERAIVLDDGVDVLIDVDGDAVFIGFERLEGVELGRQQEAGMKCPGLLACLRPMTSGDPLRCRKRTCGQCLRS